MLCTHSMQNAIKVYSQYMKYNAHKQKKKALTKCVPPEHNIVQYLYTKNMFNLMQVHLPCPHSNIYVLTIHEVQNICTHRIKNTFQTIKEYMGA